MTALKLYILAYKWVRFSSANDNYYRSFERMIRMKLYTQENFERMKQLKQDLDEIGESDRFTVKMIQRRLRIGTEKADQLFSDLTIDKEDGE